MSEPRALVVEDDTATRLLIEARLRAIGFHVIGVDSGATALRAIYTQTFNLIVTDLVLDELDGVEVLRAARTFNPQLSVIMLTARATLESAITAVNNGATAYILKPAAHGELERHALAALAQQAAKHTAAHHLITETRITNYLSSRNTITVGMLQIEVSRHSALLDGRPLQLSYGEFALLTHLARHMDEVQTAPMIAKAILDYPCSPHEARDLIKARVHKLRQKLEADPDIPRLLHSIRGAGYVLSATRGSELAS